MERCICRFPYNVDRAIVKHRVFSIFIMARVSDVHMRETLSTVSGKTQGVAQSPEELRFIRHGPRNLAGHWHFSEAGCCLPERLDEQVQ
jgi:hypothetical protein